MMIEAAIPRRALRSSIATSTYAACVFLALWSSLTHGASVGVSGTVFSEPMHEGLSEADGEPALAITVDFDIADSWFLGTAAYKAGNASSPQRTESFQLYAGWRWEHESGAGFDVSILSYDYRGDFVLDWDFTELMVTGHVTRNLSIGLSASNDYFGQGVDKTGATATWIKELRKNTYLRLLGGVISLNGQGYSSYRHAGFGVGHSKDRFNLELMVHANDAKPMAPFAADQLDNRIVLGLSYLLR